MSNEILFIHGMFMTPKSWDKWQEYFTQRGYTCRAPAWPLHQGEPENLRAQVPEGTGDIMLEDVILEMEKAILECKSAPILIGHSVGGLLTQVLVNKGLASAGVCVSSVAPNAMLSLDWHFLKSTVPILNPIKGDAPQEMSPELFHEAFANTLSPDQARSEWAAQAVHESRNVLRSSMGSAGHVDLEKKHVPLLFVTGREDHIVPPSLVERNVHAYAEEGGIRDLQIFEGRSHYICNEPGWEEVAAYIDEWLDLQIPKTSAIPATS